MSAPKKLRRGEPLQIQKRGERGAGFDADVDLSEGSFVDIRFLGRAGRLDGPDTYDSSLLLAGHRVRGIGFNFVGRQNFRAKLRIPAGWHQNRVDPSLPTSDPKSNWHEPIPNFSPTDFEDFVLKCADRWNVELPEDGRLI